MECKDINKPCIWDNERGVQECLDMDALTRKDEGVLNKPKSVTIDSIPSETREIQSITDISEAQDQPSVQQKGTEPLVKPVSELSEQIEKIDFTQIEYIKNSIQSRINSIRNDKDKDNINKRLFELNREYGKIKSILDLIGSILRNYRKNPNYFNLESALSEQKSKLSEYENDSKYFRNIINSIMIKKKGERYDDDRRGNNRYDDVSKRERKYSDDRRGDRRDDKLNQKLQEYDQGQKEIGRLNKEIGQERPQQRPQVMSQQQAMPHPQVMPQQQAMPQRLGQRLRQAIPQQQKGMPQRPQQQQQQKGMPYKKDIDPKMTFKQKRGIDRREPGQPPKRLKDIDKEKYIFERKRQLQERRPDIKRFDKRVENKYVPDVRIDKYAVNDLMHILKDVKHSDKDKFYNILNNEYLYRNSNIDEYLLNIDNYLLDRYRLFMERLSKDNTEEEKLAIIQLLTEVNQKPDIRKRRTINKRNK